MAWPKGKSRKPTGETDMTAKTDAPKKTLDDLVSEMKANTPADEPEVVDPLKDAPNKKAVKMPAISQATREQMLNELAVKFNTTPEEIAEKLMVGEPVPIAPSPNNEIEELPAGTVLIPVVLKRDYWAHRYSKAQWPTPPTPGFPGDNRFTAGMSIKLPGKEARRLIASGAAERNDPLPDDMD